MILRLANTCATLEETIESDLNTIKVWVQASKLTVNIKKTQYLPFTLYVPNLQHLGDLIIVQNTIIREIISVKYLGILTDRIRWE